VGAAAAEHLVSQPAVSAQIRRMEGAVGERLFVRSGRRIAPTALARDLAREAEQVVAAMDAFEAYVAGALGLQSGHLRVGNIDAASVYVLPETYREFHQMYPGVTVEIMVGDSRELLAALHRGDVEIATTTLPVDDPAVEATEIYRERLVVVTHPENPLCRKRRVDAQDIVRQGLITYPGGATTRRLIDRAFAREGVVPRARMEISSPEAMRRLTEAGLGVALLPEPVVAASLARGALRRIRNDALHVERAIGLVHRGDNTLSPAARAFVKMTRSTVKPAGDAPA